MGRIYETTILFQCSERTASVRQQLFEAEDYLREACSVCSILILLEEEHGFALFQIEVFLCIQACESSQITSVCFDFSRYLGIQLFLVVRISLEQIPSSRRLPSLSEKVKALRIVDPCAPPVYPY